MNIDSNIILAGAGGSASTLIAVFVLAGKFLPRIIKYFNVATDAVKLAEDLLAAIKDDKIDPEEMKRITDDVLKMKGDLKK